MKTKTSHKALTIAATAFALAACGTSDSGGDDGMNPDGGMNPPDGGVTPLPGMMQNAIINGVDYNTACFEPGNEKTFMLGAADVPGRHLARSGAIQHYTVPVSAPSSEFKIADVLGREDTGFTPPLAGGFSVQGIAPVATNTNFGFIIQSTAPSLEPKIYNTVPNLSDPRWSINLDGMKANCQPVIRPGHPEDSQIMIVRDKSIPGKMELSAVWSQMLSCTASDGQEAGIGRAAGCIKINRGRFN